MIRPRVRPARRLRPPAAAQPAVAAVDVAAQAGHDAAQLRRRTRPSAGARGEPARRRPRPRDRPGGPTPSPAQRLDLALAAGPRRDRQPRVDPQRPFRGSRAVSGSPMVMTRTRARSRPTRLRISGLAASPNTVAAPSRLTVSRRAGVAIDDDAAEPASAHGRDHDPADPAGAQDDDRRPARLLVRGRWPARSATRPRPARPRPATSMPRVAGHADQDARTPGARRGGRRAA